MNSVNKKQSASPGRYSVFLREGASQKETDQTVWTAFKEGNRQAFDFIFEKNVRLLYRYGAKITPHQALVEDCIQDLFVELWNKRTLLSDTDSIKFYLFKSLRLKLIRKLTEKTQLNGHFSLPADYDAEVEFSYEFKLVHEEISQHQQECLNKALGELSKRQREAIYLRFYENMSYEQIASLMHLHINSAYNLISKAIDSLRQILKLSSHQILYMLFCLATLCS